MNSFLRNFDVVIIGGGPSGASAGIAYKKLNPSLKVAIVDKEIFPRDKSCGDAIGPGVISVLKRFSIQDILDEEPKVVSTSLSGPGQVLINNYIPEVKNKEDSIVYVIPRKELDYRILRKAINFGVEDFTGHKFDSMTKNINGWEVVISKDGIRKIFNTRLLVGADGANSRVRASLGLSSNEDKHKAIAIRAYIDSPNFIEYFNERSLFFEINVSAARGYAWAFPSRGNLINIGIGVPVHLFKKYKLNIDSLLESFILTLEKKGIIVNKVREKKSYMLPFASSLRELAHSNAALIGDAASMINPMSGEGIFYGMEAGYILANNTFDKIDSENLQKGLFNFEEEFKKRFNKHFLSCTLARIILQIPILTRRLLKIAKNDQHTIDFIVELLFDEAHLTPKELVFLTIKFLIPIKLLEIRAKNNTSRQ